MFNSSGRGRPPKVRAPLTAAQQALVESHLPLVSALLRDFRPRDTESMDRADLFQEGVRGLLRASERYRSELGTFRRFAKAYVRGAILDAISSLGGFVHQPRSALIHGLQRPKVLRFSQCRPEDRPDPTDWRPSDPNPGRIVDALLSRLRPQSRDVIRLHYIDGLSLEKTGAALRLSPSRVCRIKCDAIRFLKSVAKPGDG